MLYAVYIVANKHRTTYIGVTNNLERRINEHKKRLGPGFAAKYGLDRLVYVEQTQDVRLAIAREKQLKGWTRAKKIALIESLNPRWEDLAQDWFEQADPSLRSG
ncbi:MAG TPA: GIY-YIG nuclease family protein [Chloroflexota bacterium]|jgi:putative endonuclease